MNKLTGVKEGGVFKSSWIVNKTRAACINIRNEEEQQKTALKRDDGNNHFFLSHFSHYLFADTSVDVSFS